MAARAVSILRWWAAMSVSRSSFLPILAWNIPGPIAVRPRRYRVFPAPAQALSELNKIKSRLKARGETSLPAELRGGKWSKCQAHGEASRSLGLGQSLSLALGHVLHRRMGF